MSDVTTIIRPWHPGQPWPEGLQRLPDEPERRGCPRCPYAIAYHHDTAAGLVCPSEAEARAKAGDR